MNVLIAQENELNVVKALSPVPYQMRLRVSLWVWSGLIQRLSQSLLLTVRTFLLRRGSGLPLVDRRKACLGSSDLSQEMRKG